MIIAVTIWIIGFMFTVGCDIEDRDANKQDDIGTRMLLSLFFIWPIALGIAWREGRHEQ